MALSVGTNVSIKLEHAVSVEGKTYTVSHYIDGKSVGILRLWITYREDGLVKDLDFIFYEPARSIFTFVINKAENNLLNYYHVLPINQLYETNFNNETSNLWGGITKTDVAYRGVENEGNLLVVQQKRKPGVEKPCAIRVAHYYAYSKQFCFSRQKSEAGLSITVDIRVLNNDLDVSMKDPYEHPSLVFLQMFEQVSRTWIWKWTAWSHCAAQTHMQKFETENNGEEMEWFRQIRGNSISNQGMTIGNQNGNLVYLNSFIFIC
ncbi:hypothetical protein MtrunA17_Chr6g0486171 [Medicago truncatula]|uniref:Uncharacterized protein n=1 Tax=Medicago truncatula TaxID=3880 RepID=A0A396HKG4_MEDTR|nr:hypothetical protein MtrunA17_Chr6g0486171 [Medicago truncatula]